MANTISLPYADWVMIQSIIAQFIDERSLEGTIVDYTLQEIGRQLDNQEY